MNALTQSPNAANLSASLPHEVIGFCSSELSGTQPQPMRFFYVQRFISLCGIGRGHLRVCRLRLAGLQTLLNPAPMFCSIRRGFKNLLKRASTMNNIKAQSEQTHPKTTKRESRFNCFYESKPMGENLTADTALLLKRCLPALKIKFSCMVGV